MTGLKMTKSNIISFIENYLDLLFPNPKCELNYNSDYELLIAILLSAQTTDKRVNMVTKILFSKFPSLDSLSSADINSIEDILRPLGSFRKKALYVKEVSRRILEEFNGVVPINRNDLESFSGVGRKTTNVFLAEFYNVPLIAVDTHVERVSKRLKLVKKDANVKEVEEKLMKAFKKEVWGKRHLQLVLFGRYHCKAVKPECEGCKLKEICGYKKK